MTCYSLDLRERVLLQLEKGSSVIEISQLFHLARQTIYSWKRLEKEGKLEPRDNRIRKPRKIDPIELETYIKEHPDATLYKIAKHFKCVINAVYYRIKKGKITYKKKNFYTKREKKGKEKSIKKSSTNY